MNSRIFALVLASTLISSTVFAADVYNGLPGVNPENWGGGYAVGVAGYENVTGKNTHQNVNNFGGTGGTYDHKGKGGVYGVAAGYNHQLPNNVVVGVEVGVRSSPDLSDGGEWSQYNNYTKSEVDALYTAKARLGYDAGKIMPYVVGGWAGGNVRSSQVYSPPGQEATQWEQSKFTNGYVVGAGVDMKVTEKTFVGVEYNYTNLGKTSFSGNDSTGTLTKIDSDLESHSVMARFGIKF